MTRLWRWLREPEIIGAPDCPIILRWTIFGSGAPTIANTPQGKPLTLIHLPKWLTGGRKLMVHRFLPNVEDRDCHDHPQAFWTLVLRGGYLDLVPCPTCSDFDHSGGMPWGCRTCDTEGVVIGDRMRPGTFRRRPAKHTHITQSGPRGAWTLVLMGPKERPWGFIRNGRWWPWKDYEAEFGFAMRCPTDEELEGVMLKYTDEGVVRK